MFAGSSFRPMNGQHPRIGQSQSAPWWPGDAVEAVNGWNGLIDRASKINDADTRGTIMSWVGRSDIPGTPSERYKAIVQDLAEKYTPSSDAEIEALRKRLDLLKSYRSELEARVKNAEQAYGVLTASTGAVSTPEHERMMTCIAGSVALLGLVILPIVLD